MIDELAPGIGEGGEIAVVGGAGRIGRGDGVAYRPSAGAIGAGGGGNSIGITGRRRAKKLHAGAAPIDVHEIVSAAVDGGKLDAHQLAQFQLLKLEQV